MQAHTYTFLWITCVLVGLTVGTLSPVLNVSHLSTVEAVFLLADS